MRRGAPSRAKRGSSLTRDDVRRLALALPEVEERRRRGLASFAVAGRVFATLDLERARALLKLSRDEQDVLCLVQPRVFTVGARGRQGWTRVELGHVNPWLFEELMLGAWRRFAPQRAIARRDDERRL